MKRIITILILLTTIAGLGIASLPLLLSSDAVRERIVSRVSGLTGQTVSFRGDPSVSFNPFMGIEISELEITGRNDEPLLSIERVKGKLKLLSALRGSIELGDLQLLRPRIHLQTDASGNSNWHLEKGSLKEAFDSTVSVLQNEDDKTPIATTLGRYQITDGVIEYVDHIDGSSETITNINAVFDWPKTNSAMSIQASAVLRNENGTMDLSAQTPMQIFAGGESEISVSFQSEPLEFVFDGKANTISNLFAKGSLRASTPSVNRLSDFLDFDFGESIAIIGKWEAEGIFEGTANMALLSEAKISVGENRAAGVVGLSRSETGKAKLDGTLAFNEIDLSGYMQNDIESINNAVIPAEPEGLAIDLRLSANAMSAGNLRFENLAASITSSEEGWKFDIGNATAFGGSVVGSVGSAIEGDKAQLILKFSSNDTDMDAINVAAGREVSVVSGNVSLTADLRTPLPISDPASIPINGEFSINAASGSIQGIDFLGLLDLAENTEETAPKNLESDGQTDFDTLSINAFLNDSRATVSKGEIQTSERRIQILGDADVLKGSLALTAQEVSDEGPISDRLVIGGTFSNPLVSVKPAPSTKKSKAEEEQSSTEPGSSASH